MTTANDVKFDIEQLVRAIRDGEMPDGTAVGDTHLNVLAEALNALDPMQIEALMEATGGGVAETKALADELPDRVQCSALPTIPDELHGGMYCSASKAVAYQVTERVHWSDTKPEKGTAGAGLSVAGSVNRENSFFFAGFSLAREVFVGARNAAQTAAKESAARGFVLRARNGSRNGTDLCTYVWFRDPSGDLVLVGRDGIKLAVDPRCQSFGMLDAMPGQGIIPLAALMTTKERQLGSDND